MSTTHTTNLEAPWGATIAYSRLCLVYEAAAEVLDALKPAAIRASGKEAAKLAAAMERWEEAHQEHIRTRAWAEAPAPTAEEAVA